MTTSGFSKKFKLKNQNFIFYFLTLFLLLIFSCANSDIQFSRNARFDTYYNDPGTNEYNGIDPIADEKIAELIDSAEKKVYFSFYGFKRQNIVDALIRAVDRNLEVKFAGDFAHYMHGEPGYLQFKEAMTGKSNVWMTVGNSQHIMHNKFAVIDDRFVMTGTGNITDSGFLQNNNSWTIIESPELAQDYTNEILQMMDGKFGHDKTYQDTNNIFNINGTKVEVYFSPYEDPMSRYIQAMNDARYSINFMIFAFTHDMVGRKFIEKANQGLTVRGVMDRSQFTHSQYVEVYRLAGACGDETTTDSPTCSTPLDIKRDGNEHTSVPGDWQGGGGRLHSKTMIIDAGTKYAKVLTGSFNWSPNANDNNDENLLVIHSQEIADMYLKEWQKIYDVGLKLPGDQAEYQDVIISEVNWAGSMRKICDDEGKNCTFYPYDGNEFVELYNNTDRDIDISYWTLAFPIQDKYTGDDSTFESIQKRAFIGFPEGTVIKAKSFYVMSEPDQRNANLNAYLNIDFTPYNELSNFVSLLDRRDGESSSAVGDKYSDAGGCDPAFPSYIRSFSSSNNWNPKTDNEAGFLIQLKDNRGNLLDQAGDGELQSTKMKKGGFHKKSDIVNGKPSDASRMWRSSDDYSNSSLPTYLCNVSESDSNFYIMVSMERKQNSDGTFSAGNEWDSWDDASKAGNNIDADYKDATYATPGEKNSNWK